VHKRYGDVEVLRGVDLDVLESHVICLIGGSGCGKSTLLKCANLIEPVQGGRILLEGEDITSDQVDPDRVRRHIGIVFQPTRETSIPTGSPAGGSSARPSCERWPWRHASCCWTR
jgi:ABC-type polar amino acid transport system ATPase subunit